MIKSGKEDKYMAKIDFTPSQKSAISSKDGNILVSAAAGSGKTAVLSERLARSICSENADIDISEVLVVTFTRAAATSLKVKIAEKLKEKIKEQREKGNKTDDLVRQLMSVNSASISTIHSFCYELIKQNFKELSLSPSVRIGDDTEMKVLLSQVCEDVIDRWYEDHGDEFKEICDVFVSVRDNYLSKKFIDLYEKLRGYVDGIDVLINGKLQNGTADEAKAVAEGIICENIERYFRCYEKALTAARDESLMSEAAQKARFDTYSYDLDFIVNRHSRVTKGDLASYVSYMKEYDPADLTRMSKKPPEIAVFDKLRNDFKDKIKDLRKLYTSGVDQDFLGAIEATKRFCKILNAFMRDLDNAYLERKRELALLDYTDLERFAVQLLSNENIANGVKRRFKRIYIDEYQDISPLQDEIFKRISTNNRFMVGDIKQSIYRFRGAAPDLFSSYRQSFEDHDPENPQTSARIFLSENFRCDENIIRFSNLVFEKLFNANSGKVEYRKEDALVFSKKKEENRKDDHKVSIRLIDSDEKDSTVDEAKWVAKEISHLMKNGVKGKDISIILRSTKNTASIFSDALMERGIKSCGGAKTSFFHNSEVMLAVSVLNAIDNPSRDIWLAGALKSPTFNITADELVAIANMKKGSLYKSLLAYTEKNDFEKGSNFLETLSKLRKMAQSESSNVIIREVYQSIGLKYDVLLDDTLSVVAKDNLENLYEMARTFEASAFRGLHALIKHIDAMMEKDLTQSEDESEFPDDYVRIMSVHHSKGLEYPVCFICDTTKRHNLQDNYGDLLIEDGLGVGMRLKDSTGFLKYDTLPRRALSILGTDDCLDEEMRGLYVALTRAREKLYIVASGKKIEETASECQQISEFADAAICMSAGSSYFKWIMTALGKDDPCYDIMTVSACDEQEQVIDVETSEKTDKSDDFKNELLLISENLEFAKKLGDIRKNEVIPAKMSVSVLTPSVLDDDGSAALLTNSGFADRPDFMSEAEAASGTERGIATHMFMQFCDFESVDEFGVPLELARLVSKGFLDKTAAELVDIKNLERFFDSSLYAQMKRAKKLYREKRFNVMLPAKDFTKNEAFAKELEKTDTKILVQGVMDCFFELEDKTLCVVDYKTDRVKGDRQEIARVLTERYTDQLSYYKRACEIITGKAVSKLLIWSFAISDAIEIKV